MVNEKQPITDKVVAVLKRADGTEQVITEKSPEQQLTDQLLSILRFGKGPKDTEQ